MNQREALEAEMNALIETLSGPSGPGLSGNLTDSEGFPRSDHRHLHCPSTMQVTGRASQGSQGYNRQDSEKHRNIALGKIAPKC